MIIYNPLLLIAWKEKDGLFRDKGISLAGVKRTGWNGAAVTNLPFSFLLSFLFLIAVDSAHHFDDL